MNLSWVSTSKQLLSRADVQTDACEGQWSCVCVCVCVCSCEREACSSIMCYCMQGTPRTDMLSTSTRLHLSQQRTADGHVWRGPSTSLENALTEQLNQHTRETLTNEFDICVTCVRWCSHKHTLIHSRLIWMKIHCTEMNYFVLNFIKTLHFCY